MRGEQSVFSTRPQPMHGSSPRAWGTGLQFVSLLYQLRFIPTCVGNSGFDGFKCLPCSVHPHVRGEQASKRFSNLSTCGSSPRAWGTETHQPSHIHSLRFIPTCVGNRVSVYTSHYFQSVHPHVRGEQMPASFFSSVICGSSPRAWGTDEQNG